MLNWCDLDKAWHDAFVARVEFGSQQQAAQALGLKQPAISKQIKNLENWTGMTLFKEGHKSQLTGDGERLYKAIKAKKKRDRLTQINFEASLIDMSWYTPRTWGMTMAEVREKYGNNFKIIDLVNR